MCHPIAQQGMLPCLAVLTNRDVANHIILPNKLCVHNFTQGGTKKLSIPKDNQILPNSQPENQENYLK